METPLSVLPIAPDGRMAEPEDFPGLADWWQRASKYWDELGRGSVTLLQNVDYRRKLSQQFPLAPNRVVFAHSAMHVAACRVESPTAVIEHQLDWAAVRSPAEGLYLCAVLNSVAVTEAATPFMTSGKGGGRHIGENLWNAPIPLFDPDDELHEQLVTVAAQAEALVATLDLPDGAHGNQRRIIRRALAESEVGRRVESLVAMLLAPSSQSEKSELVSEESREL
jgi:hypothetical protein